MYGSFVCTSDKSVSTIVCEKAYPRLRQIQILRQDVIFKIFHTQRAVILRERAPAGIFFGENRHCLVGHRTSQTLVNEFHSGTEENKTSL